MTVTKFVASPDLLEPVKPVVGTKKYPWRDLEVGEAFGVEPGTANWTTISTVCYKWSKKLGRKFRARRAPDGWIAVVRLPDTVGAKEPESHG
jgi:hypothetical protein